MKKSQTVIEKTNWKNTLEITEAFSSSSIDGGKNNEGRKRDNFEQIV